MSADLAPAPEPAGEEGEATLASALTVEQERAVSRRHGSLLLAAGAGSGKTSVIVERFVRAVRDDGVAPGRILAITFTDRAAGELRERVRARMVALSDREAARDLESAPIGTIHAFCARLLRAHALAAGLDPAFGVLDEAHAPRLRELAFARALAGMVQGAGAPAVIDLAAAYGAARLEAAVAGVHEELRSEGQRRPRLPAAPAPTLGLRGAAAALGASIPPAAAELDAEHAKRPSERLSAALGCLERARAAVAATVAGDGETPRPAALAGLSLPAANGAFAGAACEAYREALGQLLRTSVDHHARAALRILDELLAAYGEHYAALKRARGVLDFDDLELEARELLLHDAAIRKSWATRFELVMVDELQDTNRRQLDILTALERDNLFMVGDEFQSIYGFRHADVRLFQDRRTALGERDASLGLTRNFRGRPDLLKVVNAVFAPRFGESYAPLVPGRDPPVPPPDAPAVELLLTDSAGWEADAAPDPDSTLPPAPAWRQAEARMLAQRLSELVNRGDAAAGEIAVLVRAVGDLPVYARALEDRGLPVLVAGAGGYWSGQQVSDLVAYLRTVANPLDEPALFSTLASPLVGCSPDALVHLGRAARAAGATPWAHLERCLQQTGAGDPQVSGCAADDRPISADEDDDPPNRAADDPPRSGEQPPSGDAPGAGGVGPRHDPPSGLGEAPALLDALDPADRERLHDYWAWLVEERRHATRRPIAELIVRVLRQRGYEQWVAGLEWGERRLANVRKLIGLARDFEAAEGRDLRGFLEYAARQTAGQPRETDAPVEDTATDAVRLMTIHAAKGLEFDVVAVADLGRSPRSDTPDVLVDGERVGLRLLMLDGAASRPALAYEELRAERREREAREEERILYVAMTRARERLLLSGAASVERWPAAGPIAPPVSWLAPAIADGAPGSLDPEQPVRDLHPPGAPDVAVRCRLSSPATLGRVLELASLLPATRVPAGLTTSSGACERPSRPAAEGVGPPAGERAAASVGSAARLAAGPELSYTALALYARCGYRFYLERVLGLPVREDSPPPGRAGAGLEAADMPGRLRGLLVHRLLEDVDFSNPAAPAPEEVARVAADLGIRPTRAASAQVAELVGAVAGTDVGSRLAGAARVHREQPFAFALSGSDTVLSGVVDAVAHELDGGCLIVDYKSDRVGDVGLEQLTEREYGIQRRVYALAALRAGAASVEVVHWYLERPREPVHASFSAGQASALEADLERLVRGMGTAQFPVTDRPHRELCLTCPGRRELCSWDEAHTLRPAAAP